MLNCLCAYSYNYSLSDHIMNFRVLLDYLMNNRTPWERFTKLISHSGFVVKFDFLFGLLARLKSLSVNLVKLKSPSCHVAKLKPLSGHLEKFIPQIDRHVKLKSPSHHFAKFKSLLCHIVKLKFRPTHKGKFNFEDIGGRHVILGGLLIYLISFLIGVGSTGISLEKAETPDDAGTQEATLLKLSDPIGGRPSSEIPGINMSDKVGLDSYPNIVDKTIPASPEMTVPVTFLKRIFLNNLGLNIIIIAGTFSLMAFSMIVLVFNALQVGMLVKGIYNSYGLNLAATLVFPHLLVEVISHLLSLYLAYLILRQIIVPVVVKGEGIKLTSIKALKILALFSLIIIITFIAALVEIYVTPKLI